MRIVLRARSFAGDAVAEVEQPKFVSLDSDFVDFPDPFAALVKVEMCPVFQTLLAEQLLLDGLTANRLDWSASCLFSAHQAIDIVTVLCEPL